MEDRMLLQTPDYAVIVAMLVVPLGIGVFYAVRDVKKATRTEYLLGGRRMGAIPVGLSIFASYLSAIGLLGRPTEGYMYGPMLYGLDLGMCATHVLAYFFVVPLLHPLQLTSIHEYVEMRFESRAVRLVCTLMGIMQTFFYMTVALLAPGLALEAAAGIPLWTSVVIVGATGSIYTAMGGIKTVIWTDVFQVAVLFIGVFGAIIKSANDVGGLQKVFEISESGQRTRFDSFSPDPRVRHTFWGTFIGGGFMWLGTLFNQSTLQRITSVRTLQNARLSAIMNLVIQVVSGVTFVLMGWCLYAYLHHIRCDPIQAGTYSNYNQLVPFFVIHAMYELPGMAGLFMSAIFSAALSTLSSGLNALAANTVEDILQKPMRSLSEKTTTTITKLVVLLYGAAVIAMAYIARSTQGPITQMGMTVTGLFSGCIVGTITLGCTVPWANKYGAIVGVITSLVINLWLGIGGKLYGRPTPPLEPVPTDQCPNFNSTVKENSPLIGSARNYTVHFQNVSNNDIKMVENDDFLGDFSPYDISYIWYAFIGVIVCYTVGLLISRLTKSKAKTTSDPRLILGCLRQFWNLCDLDEDNEENIKMVKTRDLAQI